MSRVPESALALRIASETCEVAICQVPLGNGRSRQRRMRFPCPLTVSTACGPETARISSSKATAQEFRRRSYPSDGDRRPWTVAVRSAGRIRSGILGHTWRTADLEPRRRRQAQLQGSGGRFGPVAVWQSVDLGSRLAKTVSLAVPDPSRGCSATSLCMESAPAFRLDFDQKACAIIRLGCWVGTPSPDRCPAIASLISAQARSSVLVRALP